MVEFLHDGVSGAAIQWFTDGSPDLNIVTNAGTNGVIDFQPNNSLAMRIDSSGNLLVGKTSSNADTYGTELRSSGVPLVATSEGATTLNVNRRTSDGILVNLQKDGTNVGSIGTDSSNAYISGATRGLHFTGTAGIIPCNESGASRDADTNLGTSSTRFKDLYLSGGVYLGGTGSANKLDDYEEGTWTPALLGYSGISYTRQTGYYTKVGRLVMAQFQLEISSVGTYTGNSRIGSLPFSGSTTLTFSQSSQISVMTALNATRDDQFLAVYNGGTDLFIYSKTGAPYNANNHQAGMYAGVVMYMSY
jgi:hypothetical protein